MKRLTYLFLALSILFCGCSTFDEPIKVTNLTPGDLYAGFEEETRTYVEDGKYLRWHEDDRLTAFYGNTLNRQYKFNGATGDNSGSFSYVQNGDLETGNTIDRIYAVYPYDETTTITDEGAISLTLPAVQAYAENSFGRGANTMIAVTENVEDTFLSFKNACGYLKLKLYNAEGATVKSIEVKGNSDEKIAGAATATIAFGEAPQLTMAEGATTTITLDCGDGVALGATAETETEFWVVIPETTFAEGITITVTDTDGDIFEKSTTNEVAITRNEILPMAALNAEFVINTPKPTNNEIWYTNGSTTEATSPFATDVFGANIISNTYDVDKECWVITFDGKVTLIGKNAFKNRYSLTSITIPDSVTTIGMDAFYGCEGFTSVTIPNSVTTIERYSFNNCFRLTSITIPDSVTMIGDEVFVGCYKLASVTIGNSVTTIGDYAFYGCRNLTSVYCKAVTPPALGGDVFDSNGSGRKIYVPVESVDAYKSTECWSDYADAIVGYDFENNEILEPTEYKVGDIYTENGIRGVVFMAGNTTKVISIDEAWLPWSTENVSTGTRVESGKYNMSKIESIDCWMDKYPAFAWCAKHGDDWYLPALDELKEIYNNREIINATLLANGYATLNTVDWYWTSTESQEVDAFQYEFGEGYYSQNYKSTSSAVRAVKTL